MNDKEFFLCLTVFQLRHQFSPVFRLKLGLEVTPSAFLGLDLSTSHVSQFFITNLYHLSVPLSIYLSIYLLTYLSWVLVAHIESSVFEQHAGSLVEAFEL